MTSLVFTILRLQCRWPPRLAGTFAATPLAIPAILYQILGSYIPFPRTRAAREASGDPRRSIEERYRGVDDYVQRVRSAALELIRGRYMLEEDLDAVLARARSHWDYATGSSGIR